MNMGCGACLLLADDGMIYDGLGALGEVGPSNTELATSLWNGTSGSVYKEIAAGRTKARENISYTTNLLNGAEKIQDPALRAQAIAVAQQAVNAARATLENYNNAAAKYDELSNEVYTRTAGAVNGGSLGIVWTVPLIVAVVVSVGYLASQVASLIGAARGTANATEGYISQSARLLESGGVAVEKTANSLVTMLMWGGLAVAGVLVFKELKARGMLKGSR